jgi:membrane-associated protease RseP (regulator of RpoE activity)
VSHPSFYPESDFRRPTIIHQLAPLAPRPVPIEVPRDLTFGRILFHLFLFALTALTTTGLSTLLFYNGDFSSLGSSVLFSFTLLSILGAHEMGHYIACRWYGVQATLPYFIPAPIGIGTFGAFIKIKSPIPNRRALFDIGIAGPLAGFVFAVPAAIIAHYYAASAPPASAAEGAIIFHNPLLFQFLEWAFQLPDWIELNPVWFASWVGLLMTSINLLPVGQLDGGHVVYAVCGARAQAILARVIYFGVLVLAGIAILREGWLGWVIYAVLLTFILRVGHPPVLDEEAPLGTARRFVAVIGLIVFILCFMPVPISIVS